MGYKSLFLFNFILATYLSGAFALVSSPNPLPVGANLILSVNPQMNIPSGSWLFKGGVIVFWYPGRVVMPDSYKNRLNFNTTSYQVTLQSVSVSDSGMYVLQGIGPDFTDSITVTVIEAIKNVTLTASRTDPVEFNSSVTFTCNVLGTSPSFTWYKGSSVITAGSNVLLSSDGSTLTISNITRYDRGPFTCAASNSISNGTSSPVTLNIYYGPSNLAMTVSPIKMVHMSGSNINLTCTSESNPPAVLRWSFNGTLLSDTSQTLQLKNVMQTQTGTYSCSAQNTMTLRYATATSFISILDPVTSAAVTSSSSQPIYNRSVVLTCATRGPVSTTYWLKDGTLYSNSRSSLSNLNTTLTVNSLVLGDNGGYQCVALNAVSNVTSSVYVLTVNYGPWNITISGPAYVATSSVATLNCSASSVPTSSYSWTFNGSKVADGSVYQTGMMVSNRSGDYTCTAYNSITGISISTKLNVAVIDPITSVIVVPAGVPKHGRAFGLGCDIRGLADSVSWTKDGRTMSNTTLYLYFNSITFADNGIYQCKGSNGLGSMTSMSYNLTANYGPWNVTISGPSVVAARSSVLLSCSASSQPTSSYSWYFNSANVANGSVYQMSSIPLTGNGEYTCVASNSITAGSGSAKWTITVIDPVTSITAVPSGDPKHNTPFQLTCDTNGSPSAFFWMKDGRNISNTNKVFQINSVSLIDNGSYQCGASNAVSRMTSAAYSLIVNYGPWNVSISAPSIVAAGSSVTLTCYASSQPTSSYSWFLNGSRLVNGSVYQTSSILLNQTGEYTCTAYNSITASTSNAKQTLTVIEPITAVRVVPSGEPKHGQPFTLTCQITGYANSVSWMRNGTTMAGNSARELKFDQIQRAQQASYVCVASNALRSMTSAEYNLMANYGPLSISISGPTEAEQGTTVTLNCSADSYPVSQYSWYFGSSKVANSTVLQLGPLSQSNQGQYRCTATNSITGITLQAAANLIVYRDISSVMVTSSLSIPQADKDFQLVCEVTGRHTNIQWMKNNLPFSPPPTAVITQSELTFKPLQTSDDGTYVCVGTGMRGQNISSASYNLEAYYGPVDVSISIDASQAVTFTCDAKSNPPSEYRWLLDGNEVGTGDTLQPTLTTTFLGTRYTCEAKNPLTNVVATVDYNVPDPNAATSLQISMLTALCSLALPLLTLWV